MSRINTRETDRKVRFTPQALQTLKLRGIKESDVRHALSSDTDPRVDSKTGHLVTRMGNVRIVSKEDEGKLIVLTAMRAEEFL